jgi:hypothetical protein
MAEPDAEPDLKEMTRKMRTFVGWWVAALEVAGVGAWFWELGASPLAFLVDVALLSLLRLRAELYRPLLRGGRPLWGFSVLTDFVGMALVFALARDAKIGSGLAVAKACVALVAS